MRRLTPCLHLERRPSSFYWRWRVPEFFLKNASNRFLVFSLKTHVVREVEVLAHRLTWRSTLAFDYARGVANMETGLMERVLSELVRFEIAASDHARAVAPERTRVEAQLAIQREQALKETLREALFLGNREAAREPVRSAAGRLCVQIAENTSDWMILAYEATRVLLDLSMERARRDQGVYSEPSRFFQAAIATEASTAPAGYGSPRWRCPADRELHQG
ncbi:DUF6538 domain-containing protein [Leisingera sp. MMG026]|uniref:DUF6538 domain-containing protein n=1 Tax=Leisingera sp. MMG026 TaxID=2909982 RepID=UPI001F3351B3|nr:DUF6538 domain-containing protein [Leisingera sp. MMG026]MCF6431009.1 hypothetical protein [Leisingera sp. MMG026]